MSQTSFFGASTHRGGMRYTTKACSPRFALGNASAANTHNTTAKRRVKLAILSFWFLFTQQLKQRMCFSKLGQAFKYARISSKKFSTVHGAQIFNETNIMFLKIFVKVNLSLDLSVLVLSFN